MNKNVCEMLLDVLAEAGVKYIFGIPGDAINNLVDAIRRQDVIRFIQVRHEEAGAFAASAQAKLTGSLGVCVGTAGPGAIHLLNGLYDAKMDHAPVLAITGQVSTKDIGNDYHQEIDLYTLFKDVAAFNQTVMTPEQMPRMAVQACQTALAHHAVAHLSLPQDIASQSVPHPERRRPLFQQPCEAVPCGMELDQAAALLNQASRVAVLAGIGCLEARDELIELAEILGAPIIRTLRAKELLPDEHPLSLGGLGLLGTRPAVKAMENCDALLMVGTDFPYEDFYPKATPAVQIDRNSLRLGRRYPVDIGLVGHARPTLTALIERLQKKSDRAFLEHSQSAMKDWLDDQEQQERSSSKPIRPQMLARKLGDLARDDAIFTCDTGTVTVWGARHLRTRARQCFTLSSSLASMAFGLPGAIGAQLVYPERQVVALVGDGGFSMLMGDFLVAVKYELPITVVIFNNAKLGLIQVEQEVEGMPDFQTDLNNPDFAALARICGGEGIRVTEPEELESALSEALSSHRPTVVDVIIDSNEKPMPPKIELGQAIGYSLAKAKEFLGR